MRALISTLLLALAAAAAEPPVPVSELVSTLTSALATDRNDRRMAHYLAGVRLSESLSEETIGILSQLGAGPLTVGELEKIRKRSAGMPAPGQDPISTSPAPSPAEQARLRDAMLHWSAAYLARLPDLVCTRTVRWFRNYAFVSHVTRTVREHNVEVAEDRWHAIGSFSGEAGFVGGRDYFHVAFVDGKPFHGSSKKLGSDYPWGDLKFGGLMLEILDPGHRAAIEWDRWEVLRARRMAVFRYAVDALHSQLHSSPSSPLTLAHRGVIYVDPQTGAIGRLILYGTGLTLDAPINAVGDVFDYGEFTIGEARFILPRSAVTYVRAQHRETRQEIEYRDYRKVEARREATKAPSPVSPAYNRRLAASVSDLVATLTCALATDRDDQRIARSVKATRLSEDLSEETIRLLKQMGVGPLTILALEAIRTKSSDLPKPSEDPVSAAPVPSATKQARMLDAMRRWSGAYLASLPDFVCTRTVRQFRNYTLVRHPSHLEPDRMEPVADDRWHASGSYSGAAGTVGGRDYYRVALVDNKPFHGSFEQLGRDVLWGEFGGLMTEILDPSREATLEWDHWEVYRAHRMAVFRYAVDLKHSRYWLRSPTAQPVMIAHRGLVYLDPQTGVVGRLILYGIGLTFDAPINAVADVLDYGEVAIGGATLVLPLSGVSYVRAQGTEAREEIEYHDYRKFQSDSTVKFDQP